MHLVYCERPDGSCVSNLVYLVGGLYQCLCCPYLGNENPNWLICLKGVETIPSLNPPRPNYIHREVIPHLLHKNCLQLCKKKQPIWNQDDVCRSIHVIKAKIFVSYTFQHIPAMMVANLVKNTLSVTIQDSSPITSKGGTGSIFFEANFASGIRSHDLQQPTASCWWLQSTAMFQVILELIGHV